jgi:hypothetical protein
MKLSQSVSSKSSFIIFSLLLFSCTSNVPNSIESDRKSDDSHKIELSESDIKVLFTTQIQKFVDSYKTNNHKRSSELGGGWCQVVYNIDTNVTYDIEKTNSILSPYRAVLNFRLYASKSSFHKSKPESDLDDKIENEPFEVRSHSHIFEFKDNSWLVVNRNNQNSSSSKIVSCDEVIQTGLNRGDKNIFGCWESE